MTRCFGWSLPSTCLVPFVDMLNHNNESATHYLVHKKYERNVETKHEQYKIKKNKMDFSLYKDE